MPTIIKADKISPFFESFYPFKDIKISIQNIHTNSPLLKLFLSLTTSLIDCVKNWYHKEIDTDQYEGVKGSVHDVKKTLRWWDHEARIPQNRYFRCYKFWYM